MKPNLFILTPKGENTRIKKKRGNTKLWLVLSKNFQELSTIEQNPNLVTV